MGIARGYVGSQIFGQVGQQGPHGGVAQSFTIGSYGTFYASLATNNPAFQTPRLTLYRIAAGQPESFANMQVVSQATGMNGFVGTGGLFNAGELAVVTAELVPVDFRGFHTAFLNVTPPVLHAPIITIGQPNNIMTLNGTVGAQLWWQRFTNDPWTPYYGPVAMGPFLLAVRARATKDNAMMSAVTEWRA